MKKFLSVLLMVAGLMSCGDDDKPFIPELNKLTSVTCTKNGNAFFNANITYDQDKQINRIITTVQRNYPIGSVDLNRNHSSDVLV